MDQFKREKTTKPNQQLINILKQIVYRSIHLTNDARRRPCHNTIRRNTRNNNRVSPNDHIITNCYITQNSSACRNIYIITYHRDTLWIKLSPNGYALPNYNSIAYFRPRMKYNADPTVRKTTPLADHSTKRDHRIEKKKNKGLT